MQRSDRNRWVTVGLLVAVGWIVPLLLYGLADLFYPGDVLSVVVFYGGTLATTAAITYGVRRMTRTRRWWLIPLLASPATLVLVFTVAVNLALQFGPVSPSHGEGIATYQPPWVPSSTYMPDWLYSASWGAGGERGSSYRVQDRTVWIYIKDHSGKVLAQEEFELHCGHPSGAAKWPVPEYVEITMSESQNDTKINDYEAWRARTVTRPMFRVVYQYDAVTKRFRRTDMQILNPQVMRDAE